MQIEGKAGWGRECGLDEEWVMCIYRGKLQIG